MKIIGINASNYGCTGLINLGILDLAEKNGMETYSVCGKGRTTLKKRLKNQIYVGNSFSRKIHSMISFYSGYQLIGSFISTNLLVKKLEEIKPDLIHLHIMHTSYINMSVLIKYINKNNIPVVWTMHDCWAFTGQCPYFDSIDCQKWKSGCNKCPQLKRYPASKWFDHSNINYSEKKRLFTSIEKMVIVTPSEWLAGLIKESFLNKYAIRTIYNGIDTSFFYPRKSNLRSMYNLRDSFVVLGVAGSWEERKGLIYFAELAKKHIEDISIVIIGVNDENSKLLPESIIKIKHTFDRDELAEWYSTADVFLNPTLEDNFPTVNIEALSCGTPIITFNTGGSPEAIDSETGIVVAKGDFSSLCDAVITMKNEVFRNNKIDACVRRASNFDQEKAFLEYINLYQEMIC